MYFLERGREGDKEGEASMCDCLLSAPYWRPGPQPTNMPWLGIEPVTMDLQADTQSAEPPQPGQKVTFHNKWLTLT